MKSESVPPGVLSRRSLFGLFARLAAAIPVAGVFGRALPAAAESPDPAAWEQDVLSGMVYELFPHRGLAPDYYAAAAKTLLERAADKTERLRAGIAELDALCGEAGWAGSEEAARVAALKKIEQGDFFHYVHSAGIELIYRDPKVWDLIGYGGNALKRGGYLTQGFNDIDWLPKS